MKIEHIAFQVADPAAMAEWYVRHLGFRVRRSSEEPVVARFMADVAGTVMLEVYHNPKVPVPDYASMDPALLHVAFVCATIYPGRRPLDGGWRVVGPWPGDCSARTSWRCFATRGDWPFSWRNGSGR